MTPKVVLVGDDDFPVMSFLSSTGDTDLTVLTLALEERESLLDVLRNFEMLLSGEAGDFFMAFSSVCGLRGNLTVAGFAGLCCMMDLPGEEEDIPLGIDDLGGGGGGGIPASNENPELFL